MVNMSNTINLFDGFAVKEQGFNHIKANKECQDSAGFYCDELMSIAVVADGHGSDNYPRTAKGSSFAVQAAMDAIKEFVNAITSTEEEFIIDDKNNTRLKDIAKYILLKWHDSVAADVTANPFTEAELENVSDKYRKKYESEDYYSKAYGTTLIAICTTKEFWFGIHIGDGKCIAIDTQGNYFEPIPWDEDCQANITTSICDADAFEEFRYYQSESFPLAIFIGSDGVDDSYASLDEMCNLYRSIFYIIGELGREEAIKEVQEFIPNLSRRGSGDDISIGVLYNSSVSNRTIELIKARLEVENALAENIKLGHEYEVACDKHKYLENSRNNAQKMLTDLDEKIRKAEEEIHNLNSELSLSNAKLESANKALKELEAKQEVEDIEDSSEIISDECVSDTNKSITPENDMSISNSDTCIDDTGNDISISSGTTIQNTSQQWPATPVGEMGMTGVDNENDSGSGNCTM